MKIKDDFIFSVFMTSLIIVYVYMGFMINIINDSGHCLLFYVNLLLNFIIYTIEIVKLSDYTQY